MNIFEKIVLFDFDYKVYWKKETSKYGKGFWKEKNFFDWIKPKTKVLDIAAGNSGLLSSLKRIKRAMLGLLIFLKK